MIFHGDGLKHLMLRVTPYRCIIADVPDNIGLKYQGYVDKMLNYPEWLERFIKVALDSTEVLFLTYNHVYHRQVLCYAEDAKRRTGRNYIEVIWTYTFGQYQDDRFTNCWRPILIFGDDLNYDGIRVVSERQRMGDKRAAGLKVPGDVWDFPRVVGNSPERRPWHVTQLPEALVMRMVMLGAMRTANGRTTPIPEGCCDPFLGSGTTGVVCNKLGVKWDGIELSEVYFQELKQLFKS